MYAAGGSTKRVAVQTRRSGPDCMGGAVELGLLADESQDEWDVVGDGRSDGHHRLGHGNSRVSSPAVDGWVILGAAVDPGDGPRFLRYEGSPVRGRVLWAWSLCGTRVVAGCYNTGHGLRGRRRHRGGRDLRHRIVDTRVAASATCLRGGSLAEAQGGRPSPPPRRLGYRAEVHWYEAHGIGRVEMKIKRFLDE